MCDISLLCSFGICDDDEDFDGALLALRPTYASRRPLSVGNRRGQSDRRGFEMLGKIAEETRRQPRPGAWPSGSGAAARALQGIRTPDRRSGYF